MKLFEQYLEMAKNKMVAKWAPEVLDILKDKYGDEKNVEFFLADQFVKGRFKKGKNKDKTFFVANAGPQVNKDKTIKMADSVMAKINEDMETSLLEAVISETLKYLEMAQQAPVPSPKDREKISKQTPDEMDATPDGHSSDFTVEKINPFKYRAVDSKGNILGVGKSEAEAARNASKKLKEKKS